MRILNTGFILLTFLLIASCDSLKDSGKGSMETDFAGFEVFDESNVHTVELFLSEDDWQAIIDEAETYQNVNPIRPYYHAQLRFDGKTLESDIGIRLKGNISIKLSEGHSFPLKLDFNRYADKQTLDGLKKLNLNNNFNGPSLPIMRDYISYNAWSEFGVAASRTSLAHVIINQENLGVYVLLEEVDGDFIKRHFSEPYGDLYKPEQISGTLEYRGSNISDYPDIGLEWPDESDHTSLLKALEVLNSGRLSDIEQVFDIEGVLTYLAGNVALGSGDYYPTTGHNYYLYEELPGRFTMLPWDMNGSQEPMIPALCSPIDGFLSKKLLEDPVNEAKYFEILTKFLMTAGSVGQLTIRLNTAKSLLGSEIPAEKFERLRQDIITRVNRLKSEIGSTTTCL
jgi:spore coat protein CotH